jgi:hypothetical protein
VGDGENEWNINVLARLLLRIASLQRITKEGKLNFEFNRVGVTKRNLGIFNRIYLPIQLTILNQQFQ